MKRRTLISGLAAMAAAAKVRPGSAQVFKDGVPVCHLITQDVTGPYHLDHRHVRSDITEGQPGLPLLLEFEVVDTFTCSPLAGAVVSLWQPNAEGLYSGVNNTVLDDQFRPLSGGVDMSGQTFLRGSQTTDGDGLVQFHTIFPGWYRPRPTHVHLKIHPPTFGEVATTQLYFRNEICDEVYAREPYAARGPSPIRLAPGEPSPVDAASAGDLWLDVRAAGEGYAAKHRIGVMYYGDRFGPLTDFYRQSMDQG